MTEGEDRDRWFIGGRWYLPTQITATTGDEDGMRLEVEDVGPDVPRGEIMAVYCDDPSGEMTITIRTAEPLPVELIEQVVDEPRKVLPPTPK